MRRNKYYAVRFLSSLRARVTLANTSLAVAVQMNGFRETNLIPLVGQGKPAITTGVKTGLKMTAELFGHAAAREVTSVVAHSAENVISHQTTNVLAHSSSNVVPSFVHQATNSFDNAVTRLASDAGSSRLIQSEFDFVKGVGQAERTAYLYQKVSAEGAHLKYGIIYDPAMRYTVEELAGGRLKILAEGPRPEMLQLERNLHEAMPIGPEEMQKFYIDIQLKKGLLAPWECRW